MLQLDNVYVTFNAGRATEVRALRGLSLAVAPGDFVTVIGANGAGKSTVFNVIAGTIPVERGQILLHGEDISSRPEYVRSTRIGRVFQNPALGTCPGLTVLENLALAARRGKRRGLAVGVKRAERTMFYDMVKGVNLDLED